MITEEIIEDFDRIYKVLQYFKENKTILSTKTDNGILVMSVISDISGNTIGISDVSVVTGNSSIDECIGVEALAEASYGANVVKFDTVFINKTTLKFPRRVIMHPKRKYIRISVRGNPLITNMYAVLSMKVIDPTIKDSTLQQKIDAILKTIESNIRRSENYDFAKVMLFDGSEKSAIYQLVKLYKKPFAVLDTSNIKLKEDFVLTYEDYIKFLAKSGKTYSDISKSIDEIRQFYLSNKILSEAVVPIMFDEEAIGIIRVMSKNQKLSSGMIKRLIALSQNASLKLETEGSFEIITKENQDIIDVSVGGMRVLIRDQIFPKYTRLGKRIFCQVYFPDNTSIKTLSSVANVYGRVEDNLIDVGLKFSMNMDWKDRNKLENFINSIIDLEKKGAHRLIKET
ncbi:MAG: DUF1577 domain-containing protein [Brevinematales bacterium]|nr:DUF1577 domain-containing protein [Brevinematales bacterium]